MLFSRKKTPFCIAPFMSVLVDPDKGVRPCCVFEGHLGNLKQESLAGILKGKAWKAMQKQVRKGQVPEGCVKCLQREDLTGWTIRKEYMERDFFRDGSWRHGLTQLEINSSSICNLTCAHCSVEFSSRWVKQLGELHRRGVPHHRGLSEEIHAPDAAAMRRQLKALDLRHLQLVIFKGGEPMLNEDVPATLRHLDEIGVLGRVTVCFISNGSTLDQEVLALMHKAREIWMCVSVDGVGSVQEYIRYGPSENHRIETFVDAMAQLPRVSFSMSCSVMPYNVFSLDRVADWWNGLAQRHPGKVARHAFNLQVMEPRVLSINVLQDATRAALIEKYSRLDNADYGAVLQNLRRPFAGVHLHDDFVDYTRGLDEVRGTDVVAMIPDLAPELVFLDPERAPREVRPPSSPGQATSAAG